MTLPTVLTPAATGQLVTVAAFLASLAENPALLPLHTLQIEWNRDAECFDVSAHCAVHLTELDDIDALREWALALNGHLLLDEPFINHHGVSRRMLSAVAPMPNGGLITIWNHIAHIPAPALITA